MAKYNVGSIYKTANPYTDRDDDEDAKNRYFLYLGNTSELIDNPIQVFVATSTTQLQHFKKGGDKEHSNFLEFNAGSYGFTRDCIICFDDVKTYMNENFFSSYEPEEVGRITDENVLNQILEKINKSPKISKIIKKDIKNCFEKIIKK